MEGWKNSDEKKAEGTKIGHERQKEKVNVEVGKHAQGVEVQTAADG